MRVILALSGLLIVLIDRSESTSLAGLTYAALGAYTLYSAVLYALVAKNQRAVAEIIHKWSHWVDVGWYLLLVGSTLGTNSIFFFGFFFAILVASFQRGLEEGLRVTVVSALLFTVVGLATSPAGSPFELDRFLIRPVFLLVLGFMVARWGGYETTLNQRLDLLREVAVVANPRFGIDRTVSSLMERLRQFYDADSCVIVTGEAEGDSFRMRLSTRAEPQGGLRPTHIAPQLGQLLLSLPPGQCVAHSPGGLLGTRLQPGSGFQWRDVTRSTADPGGYKKAREIAAALDVPSFISAPLSLGRDMSGRIYVTSARTGAFSHSDADFLYQVVEQVTPVIDNIRLVDRLASDAAEAERQRIARDLHDSIIQPYIGLQIGLQALLNRYRGGRDIGAQLSELLTLTDNGIADLRGYVQGLKQPGDREGTLVPALRRFALKFSDATGIDIEVAAEGSLRLSDRLAAETFQIVAEGLSNIRRHTDAPCAAVRLSQPDGHLVVRVENPRGPQEEASLFVPRSIAERAAALGGSVRVEQPAGGSTVVEVKIPL